MKLDLSYEEYFDKPIEVVWKAISDPAALAVWLMDTDFEARIGHKFAFRRDAGADPDCGGGDVECTVLDIEPLKRLAFSWQSTPDGQPTLVEIEIRPDGAGTRLTLRHTGDVETDTAAQTAHGWPDKIAQLRELLLKTGPTEV